MPAMLRKSGLKQLKKFKDFISKQGGDISKKLKDKTTTNVLDKHIDVSDNKKNTKFNESERYLSDEEIEAGYDNFTISDIKVEKLFDDGGASGYVEIYYPSSGDFINDNWLKYDSGPRIAFDNWYPTKMNIKLKKIIEKFIKKEKLKRDTEKYNL